jgi:sarcosine oxidase subunit delta
MRIPCPYCGSRDSREFVYRGDAAAVRPAIDRGGDDADAMFDYLYLRDNPAGQFEDLWYHAQGCRNWLRVTRDTITHDIAGATLARSERAA